MVVFGVAVVGVVEGCSAVVYEVDWGVVVRGMTVVDVATGDVARVGVVVGGVTVVGVVKLTSVGLWLNKNYLFIGRESKREDNDFSTCLTLPLNW